MRSIAESVTWCRDLGATLPGLQASAFNLSATCPGPASLHHRPAISYRLSAKFNTYSLPTYSRLPASYILPTYFL